MQLLLNLVFYIDFDQVITAGRYGKNTLLSIIQLLPSHFYAVDQWGKKKKKGSEAQFLSVLQQINYNPSYLIQNLAILCTSF